MRLLVSIEQETRTQWVRTLAIRVGAIVFTVAAFSSATAAGPCAIDPALNAGCLQVDHFAVGPDDAAPLIGLRSIVLDGGRFVAAGIVPWPIARPPGSVGNPAVVRYDASGERIAWNSEGAPPDLRPAATALPIHRMPGAASTA